VDVRRVNGLVLAAQSESHFTGNSSEDLVGRVNHKPLVLHVSGLGAERLGHEFLYAELVWLALFHGRTFSAGRLLGGMTRSAAGPKNAAKLSIVRNIRSRPQVLPISGRRTVPSHTMFSYRHAFHAG